MPSPFPGMDPYLEHPALWPGVHQRFITYVGDALNALLPAHYIADIGERLYIIQPERSIYPDVAILEHPSARPPRGQAGMRGAWSATLPGSLLIIRWRCGRCSSRFCRWQMKAG